VIEKSAASEVSRPLPEPNPVTRQSHRRQAFWQITVPFLVALLVILLLAGGTIWAAVGGFGEVSRWADISVIWLLSPHIFFSLLELVIVCGLVFVMVKLRYYLPRYTRILQDHMVTVSQLVRFYADKVVEPVLRFRGLKASADKLKHEIGRLYKG
jgi:hypothetical protein